MLEIDLGFALNCYRALEISSTLPNCWLEQLSIVCREGIEIALVLLHTAL